ncbi:hypothetical protein KA005_30055 [bacterium]|nr:hypothetical protein [bacterium]
MEEGWIKIHRKIAENVVWLSEPFSRGQAWVDLIMIANRKPGYFKVRGNRVDLKAGQVGRSAASLAHRWRWSRSKVDRYLMELKKEQQIELQKSNITTLISILNYEQYQLGEPQNEPQTNINKKYSIESSTKFSGYYSSILSLFLENFRPKNKTQQDNWIDTLDKLHRIDGLDLKTIYEIIKWGREDEFWAKQFQTVIKLRRLNKEGIPFHLVFREKMKDTKPVIKPPKRLGDEKIRL